MERQRASRHAQKLTNSVILQRRQLRCVLVVLDSIARHGFSLTRSLEFGAQWDAVVVAGPCGPLCRADLAISPYLGLPAFVSSLCMMVLLLS